MNSSPAVWIEKDDIAPRKFVIRGNKKSSARERSPTDSVDDASYKATEELNVSKRVDVSAVDIKWWFWAIFWTWNIHAECLSWSCPQILFHQAFGLQQAHQKAEESEIKPSLFSIHISAKERNGTKRNRLFSWLILWMIENLILLREASHGGQFHLIHLPATKWTFYENNLCQHFDTDLNQIIWTF